MLPMTVHRTVIYVRTIVALAVKIGNANIRETAFFRMRSFLFCLQVSTGHLLRQDDCALVARIDNANTKPPTIVGGFVLLA